MLVPTADGLLPNMAIVFWARRDCDEDAILEDGGRTWTFRALAAAGAEVARKLNVVPPGEPVALSAPNGGLFAAAMMGIWLAGGVPAPVSARLPGPERARVLSSISPARTVVAAGLDLDGDVVIDTDALAEATLQPNVTLEVPRVQPDSPGIVICTSGTTGSPKPVLHTARGVWGYIDNLARKPVDTEQPRPPRGGDPVRIDARPMAHAGAIYGLITTLWRGRSIVMMPRFEPVRYAHLVREWHIETLFLVPTMIRMLLDAGDAVGSLAPPATLATSGTAPLPESWRTEFEARFGVPIQRNYGATEVSTIAVEPLDDVRGGTRRTGSVGRVSPLVEVQVRDDEGRSLGNGESGLIWVRSEALRPTVVGSGSLADDGGWIDTGDLGYVDDDNYVFLTGRARELIIRGGLKIVPAEIESVLLQYDSVLEVSVAGLPDDRLGEVPVAWVRTSRGVTEGELCEFARTRLAAYKVPTAIHVVDDFPRTESGKVRKRDLIATLTG